MSLLDLLYPPKCAFCQTILPKGEERICRHCRESLPRHCGENKTEFVAAVFSPLYYEGTVRESLHRYKFGGRERSAAAYAELMADALRQEPLPFDTLSFVPLHPKRKRSRGYDQAELLARELGRELGFPVTPLLTKVRNAQAQSGTGNAAARRANISGCYALKKGAAAEGRRVMLVDDIFTTGATLAECARILKMNGAAEVFGITAACTRG